MFSKCFDKEILNWTMAYWPLQKSFFLKNRAAGKTGLVESDTRPSIITVTSADESDVDITEAVEKTAGSNDTNVILFWRKLIFLDYTVLKG